MRKYCLRSDRSVLLGNGYAQIVGRIKDTIIRGGENIEPKEIEEVIMKHTDVIDVQVMTFSVKYVYMYFTTDNFKVVQCKFPKGYHYRITA